MNTKEIQNEQIIERKLVCPWRIAPIIDNFLRQLIHNPRKLFGAYVKPGMTVMDVGCGGGFASLGLARLVGDEGLVISADLQPKMLEMVKERAERTGLADRIHIHLCEAGHIGVRDNLDFAVALFMVHEVPDCKAFLKEVFMLLKPGGNFFLAEPKIHVSRRDFEHTVQEAVTVGFEIYGRPAIRIGRAVVLQKLDRKRP
jgi:ubiquinone/menaquinone biosynthesis C-methylase UbiE